VRVLVVEDFDQLRNLLMAALRRDGHEVDGAASMAEAVGLRPEGYQALVVDMRLGDGDAATLLDAVSTADPTIVSRTVVMTGGGFEERIPAGVPVLEKPFRIDALVAAVRNLTPEGVPPER
jgi:DNA-binding NtrC family response regulator